MKRIVYKIEKEGWNIYAASMRRSERLNSEFKEDLLVYENTVKFSTPPRNFGESRSLKVNQNQWPVYRFIDRNNEYTFLNVLKLLMEFWSNTVSIECSCL
jgi:hypothetical protein